MKKQFFRGHALPLPRARFSRCATVATDVAGINRIRVACNVALAVASNVAAGNHRHVAFDVATNVAKAKHLCAINVAPDVAPLLRWLFTNPLPLPLTPL